MKVHLVTLGCDKNTVDSERYLASLVDCGATPAAEPADADVILINTCGFIDAAKKESIDAIIEAGQRKHGGSCRAVVALGCMVERHKPELARDLPEVDLFLGSAEGERLVPELLARGLLAPPPPFLREPGVRRYTGDRPHVRYQKISEGCDHGCAFCAIPLMRGRHRSFALADVVQEAQLLELQGAREVNLVAQDLAHYGRDRRDGIDLPVLLRTLVAETSIAWYRLLYCYSAGITPRLLETIAAAPRIVRYLDTPIQHGSDSVLARMRRPERAATIRAAVARARAAIPGVAIRTTCIVGFPGETEDDLAQLLDLLEAVRFERVGVFTYSEQAGTRAAELLDDVPEPLKIERQERVVELQRAISAERYETRIGGVAQALVDRAADAPGTGVEARLEWQADDIDGITRLDRDDLAPGTIVEVRVEDVVDDYDFTASVRRIVSTPASGRPAARQPLPVAAGDGTGAARPIERSSAGSYGR
jgi:ribosomal protein S12 methylthiotransferase